jgi:hypothetical protein
MYSDSEESVVLSEMQESGLLQIPAKMLDIAKFISEHLPQIQNDHSLTQAILEERDESI